MSSETSKVRESAWTPRLHGATQCEQLWLQFAENRSKEFDPTCAVRVGHFSRHRETEHATHQVRPLVVCSMRTHLITCHNTSMSTTVFTPARDIPLYPFDLSFRLHPSQSGPGLPLLLSPDRSVMTLVATRGAPPREECTTAAPVE